MCETVMWCNLLKKVLQRKLVHKIGRKITGNTNVSKLALIYQEHRAR